MEECLPLVKLQAFSDVFNTSKIALSKITRLKKLLIYHFASLKTSVKKAIILMKKVFLANSIKTSYNGRNYTNSLPYQAMLVMRQILRQSQLYSSDFRKM